MTNDRLSRYYSATQTDGQGWLVFRLDAIGSASATVLSCNLTELAARELLAELRTCEVLESEYPIELVDADLRAAGGEPRAIGARGSATVRAALAKRRENAS